MAQHYHKRDWEMYIEYPQDDDGNWPANEFDDCIERLKIIIALADNDEYEKRLEELTQRRLKISDFPF